MAIWAAISLTGGTSGALDNIPVSELSDGDRALVITTSGVYHYSFDTTSGATESSPDVIKPDDTTGDERWLLEEIKSDAIDTGTADSEIPTNADLGSAATKDVGTGSTNVPQNSDLSNSAYRTYTISTNDPSGGSDGDVWYKV